MDHIKIITFILAGTFSGLLSAQSPQLSFGADLALPQGDFNKEFGLGVGPTVGLELPFGEHLGVTVQAGYTILMLKDEAKDILDGASLIPAQAGLKYYFTENQRGVYLHGQLGIHSFTEKFKELPAPFEREAENEFSTNFSWAIGAGYQLGMLDIGVRFNSISPKEEEGAGESDPFNYIGLRVAYLLDLGN